jgi:2-(1,2-epoxy-1,2-dihydrophenyl)acetyl-CoA isomerase
MGAQRMTRRFETLEIYREMNCGWVTFNRPKVMNAFDRRQWTELDAALADLEQDEDIRCVVLRGSGGNFSSGYDLPAALAELAGVSAEGVREHIRPGNQACWRVWRFRKPVPVANSVIEKKHGVSGQSALPSAACSRSFQPSFRAFPAAFAAEASSN